jgi:hypothetical protein
MAIICLLLELKVKLKSEQNVDYKFHQLIKQIKKIENIKQVSINFENDPISKSIAERAVRLSGFRQSRNYCL